MTANKLKTPLLGAAIAATMIGQDVGAAGLEEIVVTATKREESLQDVPVSADVHTGHHLENLNLSSVADMVDITPGLVVNQGAGNANIFIRGVGSKTGSISNESSVATYIDGIYQSDKIATNQFNFLDIERIEVLKGPQGTLFGRNATGGAISIVTKKPTDEFSALLEGTVADFGTYKASGYISGGITDTLAASVAFAVDESDGFLNYVNPDPNSPLNDDEVSRSESEAVRAKLVWAATENLEFTLSGTYMDAEDNGLINWQPITDVPTLIEGQLGIPISRERHDYAGDGLGFNTVDYSASSLTVDWSINDMDFKSITSYTLSENSSQVDIDVSPIPAFTFVVPSTVTDTFQQEVQLSSETAGGVRWIVGGIYFNDKAEYEDLYLVGGVPYPYTAANVAATTAGAVGAVRNWRETDSIALFGEVGFDIAESTSLTLGLRYTEEDLEVDPNRATGIALPNATLTGFDFVATSTPFADESTTFDEVTWSLVVDHQFQEDVMGYASYKRGFKSGVYNITSAGGQNDVPTEPELLDAYEIGLKSTLLENTLRLNMAAFYYDYQDLQVSVTDTSSGAAQITENAAEAEIYGLDFSGEWVATDQLSITFGGSILDTEYTEYANATVWAPLPAGLPGFVAQGGLFATSADLSGEQLPYSPDFTFNLGATYDITLDNNSAFTIAANWNYNDGFILYPQPEVAQDSFSKVNASITWTSPAEMFYVKVYGTNLLDEDIISSESTNDFGQIGTYLPPETYGVTVGIRL